MTLPVPLPLAGYLPDEITDTFGLDPPYRGEQIFHALWRGAETVEDITTLPLGLRSELSTRAACRETELVDKMEAPDGTTKIVLRCSDGFQIETVLLVDEKRRKTACLSTQAGCPIGCVFCKTGEIGFARNLTASEITEQVLELRRLYGEISNIVFMGMGEPLLNLAHVRKAVLVLSHSKGLNIGLRKFTLSTCGIIDKIEELATNGPPVRLALSLVSAEQKKREELIPAASSNPLPELQRALVRYQEKTGKRITFEYILLPGINDGAKDAEQLAFFASPFNCLINLIPWNPVKGMPFKKPSERETADFISKLESRNLKVSRRYRKGNEINGACGQLGGSAQKAF